MSRYVQYKRHSPPAKKQFVGSLRFFDHYLYYGTYAKEVELSLYILMVLSVMRKIVEPVLN